MQRRLPPEYDGWLGHEPAFRRLTTPELILEVQDGPPDRRLAALSVIDLVEVPQETLEDWVRTLPDTEANELAGAIPAQRQHVPCDEDLRWVDVARLGYERRRLPTFLVMLFSSLDAMEARKCKEAAAAWTDVSGWLELTCDDVLAAGDSETFEDICLFVFENYLDHDDVFESFLAVVGRHPAVATEVSSNPSRFLAGLPPEHQVRTLKAAARAGGLPFDSSWALLREI
ncbi:MAG: hypothetical protein HY875_00295 [Chloroflexi bacterium]|nr:hypothetical protein [Chloroflexota bacterium]